MTIENFLREKLVDENAPKIKQLYSVLDKMNELSRLESDMVKLRDSISESVIDEWYRNLRPKWGNIIIQEANNFKLTIQGVQCGCWPNDYAKPIRGFYSQQEPTAEQKAMVEEIIERAKLDIPDIGEYKPQKGYIEMAFTKKGDEICDAFYRAAKELGYLN